jgi:hypothetical protein
MAPHASSEPTADWTGSSLKGWKEQLRPKSRTKMDSEQQVVRLHFLAKPASVQSLFKGE